MKVQVFELGEPLQALRIGSISRLLWVSKTVTLAGFGNCVEFKFDSIDGFSEAHREMISAAGVKAFGFASLDFDRSSDGVICLPEFVYIDDGSPKLVVADVSGSSDNLLAKGLRLAAELTTTADASLSTELGEVVVSAGDSETEQAAWTESIAQAVTQIEDSDLNKVVVARRLTATADADFSVTRICHELRRLNPSSMLFVNKDFVGASPETLVAKNGSKVTANPLAGTQRRSEDVEANAQIKADLRASTKDQWEHRITIDWFLDTLLPYCSYVDADPEPVIVELANLLHLGTRVDGVLSSPETLVSELVAALHPTPAVGGEPQAGALEQIKALETFDRGRYAGPVGWLGGDGDGEFAVGIRSALVGEHSVDIFAGVGVVKDSDPEAELAETNAKFASILAAIGVFSAER